MQPIRFDGYQKILGAPVGWDAERHGECHGLPVLVEDATCISHWRPSFGERLRLLFGASGVLGVHSGQTQPPVWLAVQSTRAPRWRADAGIRPGEKMKGG